MASASRYPVATHWMVVTDVWKSRARVASATATMVVSRIDMIEPRTTTVDVRRNSGVRVNLEAAVCAMEYLRILKDRVLSKSDPGWETRGDGSSRRGLRAPAAHRLRRR